jgi:hypothetical protein
LSQVKTHCKAIFMTAKHKTKAAAKSKKGTADKGDTRALKDSLSQDLLAEAQAVGNRETQRQLQASQQRRGALLEIIVGRLSTMRHLQLKENDLLKSRDEWFVPVHRGTEHLPNPGRWKTAAEHYKMAATALCRGDIARGMSLLKRAQEAESDAHKDLPQRIGKVKKPPPSRVNPSDGPAQVVPCAIPPSLIIADRILNLNPQVADASSRKKSLHDWFGPEIEEEEENDNAD